MNTLNTWKNLKKDIKAVKEKAEQSFIKAP